MAHLAEILFILPPLITHEAPRARLCQHVLIISCMDGFSGFIFQVQQIEYYGIAFDEEKIAMSPNKTDSIKTWITLKSRREVQSFLGLTNYYLRFIKNCSKKAKPLTELTKFTRFKWNDDTLVSFRKSKHKVISALVL